MPIRPRFVCTLALTLCGVPLLCQQVPPADTVPLMQPGAPGKPTKTLTSPTVGTAQREPTAADFEFMQGMVMHHSQAVEMTGLMAGRTTNPQLLELGDRISISQKGEMVFMRRWLAQRGKPLADDPMTGMAGMPGMDHMHMAMDMPMMPGMLTPKQMDALRKAKGPEFDHLFLTGMIQHHTGALTMVKDLFATPGAAQDPQLFDFTADVDVTQSGEIGAMQNLLSKEKH
jgi:uncharacterized protein (DUF305 family)